MARFIHLGHAKHIIKPLVHLALHQGKTHHMGMGMAGVQKKDIGSFKSIQGQGVSRRKLVPLKFRL